MLDAAYPETTTDRQAYLQRISQVNSYIGELIPTNALSVHKANEMIASLSPFASVLYASWLSAEISMMSSIVNDPAYATSTK